MTLRLGTRGSKLALWQANWVAQKIRTENPACSVEIVTISTDGDRSQTTNAPLSATAGRGVFVTEIERALVDGEVDLAVHSCKDLPSTDAPGTVIAAFCERGDPRDAFISETFGSIAELPVGATLATSAPRRVAQLKHIRPDLNFVEIRGNVDTRLRKLHDGAADGLILAAAGLFRLGMEHSVTELIDPEILLPQVGQGCVAVQTRDADKETTALVLNACDQFETRREVSCERAFLRLLGGGCTAPVAAYALASDRFLYLFALVASRDGATVMRTRTSAHVNAVDDVARSAYDDLLAQGARNLLA